MSISSRYILAGTALLAVSLADARTLIHAGSLIDGRADSPRKTVTVVIDGERIAAIDDGYSAPAAGDVVIELKDATVLPGLIDCHVHLTDQQSPKSYTERFYLNPADYAYRSGVKMALGTDQGVAPHGENAKEFVYLVEAGVPPMKAIQMGTINGAMLIGKDDQFGSVEKGKLADLVAVPGDPLADINLMTKVSFVMKAGKVYKP